MKKNICLLFATLFVGIFISGCTEEVEYEAKPEHLQEIIFYSQTSANSRLFFLDGNLEVKVDRTTISPSEVVQGEVYEFVVEDYKVKTEGNTYTISGKDFEMKLERVAERMIKDESGDTFSTTKYIDEN